MVCWVILYIRLFIYQVEAEKKEEPAKEILQTQYKLMAKRLWYMITWPSAILASFFAFWMLYKNPAYLKCHGCMVKLAFVLALYFYHGSCQKIYTQLQNDVVKYSAFKLRIWNEVATIILIRSGIFSNVKKRYQLDLGGCGNYSILECY